MTTDLDDTTELLSKTTIEFSAYSKAGVLYVSAKQLPSGPHFLWTTATFGELYEGFSVLGATEDFVITETTRRLSDVAQTILREIMEQSRSNS